MTHRFGTMRRQDAVLRIKTLLLDVQWSASQYAQADDGAMEADGLAGIARRLQRIVDRYEEEAEHRTADLDNDAADDELPLAEIRGRGRRAPEHNTERQAHGEVSLST